MVAILLIPQLIGQKAELLINPDVSSKNKRFVFINLSGSVRVTGYEGEVIVINGIARQPIHQNQAKQNIAEAKEKFVLVPEFKEDEILVNAVNQPGITDYTIILPRNYSVSITVRDNGIAEVFRIDGEIEVKNPNGNIDVTNISGPVVAVSIFGSVKVLYRSYVTDRPSMITSYDGDIEVHVPVDENVSFSLKSDKGAISFSPGLASRINRRSDKTYNSMAGSPGWTNRVLNRGGGQIILNTYYGNIGIVQNDNVTFQK